MTFTQGNWSLAERKRALSRGERTGVRTLHEPDASCCTSMVWLRGSCASSTPFERTQIIRSSRPISTARWACAGPVRGYVFQHSDGRPASARDLVNDQSIAIDTIADAAAAEAYNGLFSNVFLVNYGPELFTDYDFTESKADAYNLSVLDESLAGWASWIEVAPRRRPMIFSVAVGSTHTYAI